MTKEEGLQKIEERIESFEKNKSVLMKKGHGETNIRSNYIDVLFSALGWNMTNVYEVVREFSQKDSSKTKKVDYAFKINNKVKFFVEAKEASVDLEKDKSAIYQAKRYAYSTNGLAPIVILTDFEEFRVFNVLRAPREDNPDRELMKSYCSRYTEYKQKWDVLWDAFSRDAVEKGSIERLRGKIDKNTRLMDVEFLEQISHWRELLAKNIAIRNKSLTVDEINEAVQRILDRLVFIRNLEDRGIEPENSLLNKLKEKENIYVSLIPLFRKLDRVYNGLLYKNHFSEEIEVDDKCIREIIKYMCPPVSPFQFDVIEPEILGRIYEKFLGCKIRLTEGHQAKVEEKIEVRKAGGVYYTPQYVVDYIVHNTIGKKIDGLSPKDIEKVKILDPACGSGSFLLGAYSYLVAYHQKWYSEHKNKKEYKEDWYLTDAGEVKVKLEKRGEILKNNLFGVDIDKEATEVAIMSLYLKMLDEGFNLGERDLFFGKGHVLPDMSNNIKCGNSLIDVDYFEQKALLFENDVEAQRITRPFSFLKEFSSVYPGGFDVIIGNPPYGAVLLEEHQSYLENKYHSYEYQLNSFSFFIEKAIWLLKNYGSLAYIVPAVIHNQHYFSKIRKILLTESKIKLLHLLKFRVFDQAETGDTLILLITKDKTTLKNYVSFRVSTDFMISNYMQDEMLQDEFLQNNRYEFLKSISNPILKKAYNLSVTLDKVAACVVGIKPYQTGKGIPKQTKYIVENRPFDSDHQIDDSYKKYIVGKDINRYSIAPVCDRFLKYGEWLAEPRPQAPFLRQKIVCRQTSDHLIASLDDKRLYNLNNVYNIEAINYCSNYYLLGLLNSSLFKYFYYVIVGEKNRTFAEVKKINLHKLPICITKKEAMSQVEIFVKKLLDLSEQRINNKSELDKQLFTDVFERLDNQLNRMIYEIYELSDTDIIEVENAL